MLNWIKKKKMQSNCLHDWYILGESTESDGVSVWHEADVYCPLCEKISNVSSEAAKRLVKKSEIRKKLKQ